MYQNGILSDGALPYPQTKLSSKTTIYGNRSVKWWTVQSILWLKMKRERLAFTREKNWQTNFFDNRNNREGGRLNFGEKQIEEKIKIIEKKKLFNQKWTKLIFNLV